MDAYGDNDYGDDDDEGNTLGDKCTDVDHDNGNTFFETIYRLL